MLKKVSLLTALMLLSIVFAQAQVSKTNSLQVLEGLVSRRMPQHAAQFQFRLKASDKQAYFQIRASGKKIVIEGNSPTSIAAGLHYYLKHEAHVSVSWTDFNPTLPAVLPLPKKSIRKECPYDVVTYLNYCTFGYTTTYWDWERWEKEIDLMALNGVTHPLAMVGVEEVWRRFLLKAGYTDAEAKAFLTGASYLPWMLMGNMEKLGGPLPDEWLERQVALQQKIVQRMREYGMTPIFQGFVGMVPSDFGEKLPKAEIVPQGKWFSFTRPAVLSPLDTEFPRLAKLWYEEYEKLFGKTDFYAGDLFHEGGRTAHLDVAKCAQEVERAMTAYNPEAVWILQGWQHNPTLQLLKGLSPEHAMVIELCAEFWHRWKDDGYGNIPWMWSCISNWGGNIGLHGRLNAIATRPVEAQKHVTAGKKLRGIGFTPEGIETNPVVLDLWSDMVWTTQSPDMKTWIEDYAQRRYNSAEPSLQQAWNGFYKTAYGTYPDLRQPSEPVLCAEPSLNVTMVSSWSHSKIGYAPQQFADACALFLQDADKLKTNTNYRYDVVDMVRQYISNLGRETYKNLVDAWNNRDRQAFERETKRYLQLIADQDELLRSHPAFCLSSWLEKARAAGNTAGAKNQYAYYSRLLITSWSGDESALNDYAHREWGGLLGTYYYKRWELFFNHLYEAWDNATLPEPHLYAVTETWLYENITDAIRPTGQDPVETAVKMFRKYYRAGS